jgi:pimeloyl-ACP methyl ester carboxylesterase
MPGKDAAMAVCQEIDMPPVPMPSLPSGPVLIALHSSGAGGRQWDGWRRQPPHDASWLTPDLLGYAGESWPLGAPVSLQAEAEALLPVLRAAPHGAHLIGHSYGGAVALEIAMRWPHHLRSLTLYEPMRPALLRDGPAQDRRLFDEFVGFGREIGVAVLRGRGQAAAQCFVDYWTGAGAWSALPAPRQDAIVARMVKVNAEFGALCGDTLKLEALRRVDVPVTLLCGTRSPAPALRVVDRLHETLPWVSLQRLPGLGHLGPIEAPARVAAGMALQRGWQAQPLAA